MKKSLAMGLIFKIFWSSHSLFLQNTQYAQYFLPAFLWVLVIRITNKHHVSAGCKIVGNGEESG